MPRSKSRKIKSIKVVDLNIVAKPSSVPIGTLVDGETVESAKRLALRFLDPEIREWAASLPSGGRGGWGDMACTYSIWAAHLLCGKLPKYGSQNIIGEWQLLSLPEIRELGRVYARWAADLRFASEVVTDSRSLAIKEGRSDLSEKELKLIAPREWDKSHYAKSQN
jgi:hypothetical protein